MGGTEKLRKQGHHQMGRSRTYTGHGENERDTLGISLTCREGDFAQG